MILLAYSIALALLAVLSVTLGLPRINASTLTFVVWVPLLFVASHGSILQPSLSGKTVALICVGTLAMSLGACIGAISHHQQLPPRRVEALDWERVRRIHIIGTLALIVYAASEVYESLPLLRQAGGFSAVFSTHTGAAYAFKVAEVNSSTALHSQSFSGGSAAIGLLSYIAFMGNISIFTGALLWIRGNRMLASMPLLATALYSLLSLQRTSFVMALLLMGFSTLAFRRCVAFDQAKSVTFSSRSMLTYARTAIMLTLVLLVPLQLRNQRTQNATGLTSLVQYVLTSVGGLNARILSASGRVPPPLTLAGSPSAHIGWGSYTFTGLFSVLQRFGLPLQVPPVLYDYVPIVISNRDVYSNTATSYYDFYLDLGWIGVALLPLTIGFLAARIQRLFGHRAFRHVPLLSLLLVTVLWSFFVNVLTRDVRYLIVVALSSAVLQRLVRPAPPASDTEADSTLGARSAVLA